jgi:cytochrome c
MRARSVLPKVSPSVALSGLVALLALGGQPSADEATGDPERGAQLFRSCLACHSLSWGEHRTGPSLAGMLGRRAGMAEGFARYSPALQEADVIWTEDTLDAWLADPEGVIPGNRMTFPGIDDAQARADLIAYLEAAAADAPETPREAGSQPEMPDLKQVGPGHQIEAIRYCGDTYHVTTADGQTTPFWEFNLRFKTDSSDRGPHPAEPALLPASMMGDRAFVIFADPAEISTLIEKRC